MTESDLANLAAIKIGGFGDQATGSGFIASIDGEDKISNWCKTLLPVCRQNTIVDLAIMDCPYRETIKYYDCGAALAGVSLPEIGQWAYAFNIPNNCLSLVAQINEDSLSNTTLPRKKYRCEPIANKTNNGRILLTNELSNHELDSAFIEYVADVTNVAAYSTPLINCIVILLASELCSYLNKDGKLRQSLLIEYEQLTKKNAMKFNQKQFNNYETTDTLYTKKGRGSYLGGRSSYGNGNELQD